MRYIWSPGRLHYMAKTEKKAGCVFCDALNQADGPENLIVARGSLSFAILNLYPYTSGHLMIIPYKHCGTLEELSPDTRFDIMEQVTRAVQILKTVYNPQGFNVGLNLGEAAGAGIIGHLHMHVVPRWSGDTNFLTTTNETRMIPESVEESYARIRYAWNKLEEAETQRNSP